MGTSRIIEFRNLTSAYVRKCILSIRCFHGRTVRRIAVVLLALLAYLVPAAGVSAESSLESRTTGAVASPEGQSRQYHRSGQGQYHARAAGDGRISAWNLRAGRPGFEIKTSIAVRVISPPMRFHSAISSTNTQSSRVSATNEPIGAPNDRLIGNRIGARSCSAARCAAEPETPTDGSRYHGSAPSSGNPRLMLQIGALLGLVYVAFLAAWVWATRFRIRPPRSAGT